MCGIFGVLYSSATSYQDLEHLYYKIYDTLNHRGPDDRGFFIENNLMFCHMRLSILDLSLNGHQPMIDDSSGVVITYNGEVYNFRELRKELESLGVKFRSSTDTEVVLKAYVAWGVEAFSKFDGMFAFAVYDPRVRKVFVVRDFAGIKPLYYYHDHTVFAFCSEIKGLKVAGFLHSKIDHQGFSEYLWYGNTISDHTLFSDVKKLLAGQYLVLDQQDNTFKLASYWKASDYINQHKHLTEMEAVKAVKETLELSVKNQLVSDVPVGICLSGGIDSSAVTAFAARHYVGKLKTFSVDFDFMGNGSELPNARLIANMFKTDHYELRIAAGDVINLIEESLGWHDEPFADAANLPLFLISKQLKQLGVKVILQGDGGDELFAGYRRYNTIKYRAFWKSLASLKFILKGVKSDKWDRRRRFIDAISHSNPAMMHALMLTVESARKTPFNLLTPRVQSLLKYTYSFAAYESSYERYRNLDDVQRMLVMDYDILLQHDFLEKVDKSTMANSVEVRVPFLAKPLVELALGLPSNYKAKHFEKKYLLKKALDGIVPKEILCGPKKGFGVPYQGWLKKDLRGLLNNSLEKLYENEIVTQVRVESLVNKHMLGKQDNGFMLWKLMLLGLWVNKMDINF